MAKRRTDLDGIFQRTEPGPAQEEQAPGPVLEPDQVDRTVSVGVGLKQSQLEALDAHARQRGQTRNALMREIITTWLAQHGNA